MNRIFLFLLLPLLAGTSFAQSGPGWRDKLSPEIRAAFDRGEKADVLIAF